MSCFVERVRAVAVAWVLLVLPLSSLFVVGCDRGVEANTDNLTHFAAVTSELRRDARELELLAKKVAAVRAKLERRRSEISEHVYSDDMAKQRKLLLERLEGKTEQAAVDESGTPIDAPATTDPSADALLGALTLHHQVFTPLHVFDDTLAEDPDYGWWIDELGLTSADLSLATSQSRDDRTRVIEDCRTLYDIKSRAVACRTLLDVHTTPAYFDQAKQDWLGDLDTEIARLNMLEAEFAAEAVEREASAAKVMEAYGSSFDGLIIWGFPALVIAVLIIVLFDGRRRRAGPEGQSLDTLAVITVLLLVSAIIILGLGGKIEPEALGTLIGGISGYVLGKSAQMVFGGERFTPKADDVPQKSGAAAPVAAGEPEPQPTIDSEPEPTPPPSPADSLPGEKPQLVAAAPEDGDSPTTKN